MKNYIFVVRDALSDSQSTILALGMGLGISLWYIIHLRKENRRLRRKAGEA